MKNKYNNKEWFFTLIAASISIMVFTLVWFAQPYTSEVIETYQKTSIIKEIIEEDIWRVRSILYNNENYYNKDFTYENKNEYEIYSKWWLKLYRKYAKIEDDPEVGDWFRITMKYWINWIEKTIKKFELINYYDKINTIPRCNLKLQSTVITDWDTAELIWDTIKSDIVEVKNLTFWQFVSNERDWTSTIPVDNITQSWKTNFLLKLKWTYDSKDRDWNIVKRDYETTCTAELTSNP